MAKDIKALLKRKLEENNSRHADASQETSLDFGRQHTRIALNLIDPNPFQPRKQFTEKELQSLATSIKESGLLQPVSVRQLDDRYQLISGERRLRAHHILNKTTIEALIIPTTDEEMGILALAENIDRQDLSDYEIGQALRQIESLFPSKKKLAESVGLNREDMYRYFAFEDLPASILKKLDERPNLLSRTAANQLKRLSKEHDTLKFESALHAGWTLLEQAQLEQTKLAEWVDHHLKQAAAGPQASVDPATNHPIKYSGKKVGYISRNSRQVVVKLNSVLINEEQAHRLQQFVEQLIQEKV
ncbi:ParB/RepB/Spo0J family partition protein [Rhizobium hidalgonense]|uniref:ParB/RepB/Spo0J family partition protein n=1 Tax=Rhizobium hidalgonense TaxID=1538159 RepID=A0AAJ2H4I2_9HYPH|nr:ParB/RepB/Spo0J family partition protein [Rhizobium hidalgonense]MDR9777658.1 ParB/RepB/Spo0J family partition protein [Rhizobium hidalgonense]